MRVFQAPPAARRRLVAGGLLLWLGLRIGVLGLTLSPGGIAPADFFAPQTHVAIVLLAAALAPLDLRLSSERVFLANLGSGSGEAVTMTFLTAGVMEGGMRILALLLAA